LSPFFLFLFSFFFQGALRPQKPSGLLGTGEGGGKESNLLFYAKLTTEVVGEEGDHIYLSLYTDIVTTRMTPA